MFQELFINEKKKTICVLKLIFIKNNDTEVANYHNDICILYSKDICIYLVLCILMHGKPVTDGVSETCLRVARFTRRYHNVICCTFSSKFFDRQQIGMNHNCAAT